MFNLSHPSNTNISLSSLSRCISRCIISARVVVISISQAARGAVLDEADIAVLETGPERLESVLLRVRFVVGF